MLYKFTHISGSSANHVDTVEACPIMLGRDDACQIRFDKFKDLAVSGTHAQIDEVSEGTWQIVNLSRNGVIVNGVPCDATAKLPNHSTIQLGKDGPRIRFDVDQNVEGISKTDVQKRKQKTKKTVKDDLAARATPDTEERPVFHIAEAARASGGNKTAYVVAGVVAALAAIGAIVTVVIFK